MNFVTKLSAEFNKLDNYRDNYRNIYRIFATYLQPYPNQFFKMLFLEFYGIT